MTRASKARNDTPHADERPAEIRHIQVESTPRDRPFIFWFIAAWVGSCATLLAVALLVDPLASFGTGVMRPLVPNDRDEKATAYTKLDPRPQAIIIGSSRVMKFPPSCLKEILGIPAFNFGLNSARVEDYSAVLGFVSAGGPVQHVLLGVDPEAFHSTAAPDERLLKSRLLEQFIDPSLRPPLLLRLYHAGTEALTWETVVASARALRYAFIGGRPTPAYTFDSTGELHYSTWERQVRAGHFDQTSAVEASVIEYRSRYAQFEALSAKRIAAFTEFLRRARTLGVHVEAFIPPLHPSVAGDTGNVTLAARTRDTDSLLASYDRSGLLHFARFPTLESFGGAANAYFDGAHMMEANAVRLIAAVYRAPICAIQ